MTMRLRFTIRDLLWLTVVAALAACWWFDHHLLNPPPVPKPERFTVTVSKNGDTLTFRDSETGGEIIMPTLTLQRGGPPPGVEVGVAFPNSAKSSGSASNSPLPTK